MTDAISELLRKAKEVSGRLDELRHGTNVDRAAQLVNSFIDAIDCEPNANGLSKAAHALSWHLADQLEPLPQSLDISNLSSDARRIAKAMWDSNT